MRIRDALQGVSVVYLDSSPIIDYAEKCPRSASVLRSFFSLVGEGKIRAISSAVLLPEVLNYAREEAPALFSAMADSMEVEKQFRTVLDLIMLHPITVAVGELGADVRRNYGLRLGDALHLAALHYGADALLTCDADFQRAQAMPIGEASAGKTLRIINALRITV